MSLFTKKTVNAASDACDVLLTYEIKNREIENLCLVKYELEKRGYSVQVRMQYDTFFSHHKPIDAKLVVVPAYYRNRAQFYSSSHTPQTDKILNMMWEQVRNTQEENNKDSLFSIKDWGRVASHIAWGKDMSDRLIHEWGCDPSHVFMTGHLTLDFLKKPLVNYYDSKETLFRSYGIPSDKKIHLFISSLAYADVDMRVVKNSSNGKSEEDLLAYKQLCADTRKELLDWFEKILLLDEDSVIIYRPHPEEKGNQDLFELTKRQNRFFIIKEKSIKQWILACDKIYTWMSTSITEITTSGKDFDVLRPLPIPIENDIGMFSDIEHITTFDQFREVFLSQKKIEKSSLYRNIEKYYYIPEGKFTYELVCDAIEQILHDDGYKIVPPLQNQLLRWYYPERIKNLLKRIIANSKLCEAFHKSNLWKNGIIREWIDDVFYVKEKLKKNDTSEEEIEQIINRIKNAMSSGEEISLPEQKL